MRTLLLLSLVLGLLDSQVLHSACLDLAELHHRISTLEEGTPISFKWGGNEFQGKFGTSYQLGDKTYFFVTTYGGHTFSVPVGSIDLRSFSGPLDAVSKGNTIRVLDNQGRVLQGVFEGSFIDAQKNSLKLRTADGKQILVPRTSLREGSLRVTAVNQTVYEIPNSGVTLSTEGDDQFVSYALGSNATARYPARVRRIFDEGDGLKVELEVVDPGQSSGPRIALIKAEELGGFHFRKSSTSRQYFSNRDRKSFISSEFGADAPGFQLDSNQPTQNSRLNHEGKKVAFFNFIEDRAYAMERGRIFDDVSPSELPVGKYTYVFTAEGGVSFGKIEDSWEFGSKHMHIANGRKVVAAGELEVYSTGGAIYNFESGTFTRTILKANPEAESRLKGAVKRVFQKELAGRSLKEGEPGEIIARLPSGGPTSVELLRICASSAFDMNRMKFCPPEVLRSLGLTK